MAAGDEGVLAGDGGPMPAVGLGTWALRGEEGRRAIRAALVGGYRHVDTAEMYANEPEVGDALRQSPVEREAVFLTTKVWPRNLRPDDLRSALEASLRKLKTGYVDLYLIHWPNRAVPLADTLGAMAEARQAGRVRHVGVSNFTVALLEEAAQTSAVPIFCNQVEYHPYLSQQPVLEKCRELNILVTAYCPLARGKALTDPVLREIGERHGKTAGQVALRWLIQQDGVGAIPKSASPEHQRENMDIFDFELTEAEMQRVFELQRGHRIVSSAGGSSPDWDT